MQLSSALNSLSSQLPAIHWEIALLGFKSLLLGAAFGLATIALRRSSAGNRHRLWVGFFIALVLLPLLSPTVPMLLEALRSGEVAAQVEASGSATAALQAESQAVPPRPIARDGAIWRPQALLPLLSALWVVGSLCLLLRFATGLTILGRMRQQGRLISDPGWLQTLEQARERLQLSRTVELRLGPSDQMPVTWGVLEPVILLPESALHWDTEQRDLVLRHELAHIRRNDIFWQGLAAVGCALFWLNPFCWLGRNRLVQEAERACDDAVLRSGVRPSSYAERLVAIVRDLRPLWPLSGHRVASMAQGARSSLERRVASILDPAGKRLQAPQRHQLVAGSLLGVLLLAIAAYSPAVYSNEQQAASAAGNQWTQSTGVGNEWTYDYRHGKQILIESLIVESEGELVDWRAMTQAAQGKGLPLRGDLQIAGAGKTLTEHLDALDQRGDLTILAAPRILTLSGKEAAIQTGLQVPIPAAMGQGTTGIQYVNATLRLDLHPLLRSDGKIEIGVQVQKRYPLDGEPGQDVYQPGPIQTNEFSSSFLLHDGGTVILSGAPETRDGEPGARLVVFITARVVEV